MRLRKKVIVIALIVVILVSAGIVYVNEVFLPQKVSILIVKNLEQLTQKKVSLGSLRFHIFKGIVFRDLKIYDATQTLLSVKEGSCSVLLLPLFRIKVIIPSLRLQSPYLLLQRRPDGSLNIADLFQKQRLKPAQASQGVFVREVKVTDGRIDFVDQTLATRFEKSLEKLNLSCRLSLTGNLVFHFSAEIPHRLPMKIQGSGEFRIPGAQLAAKISLRDFSPALFLAYYEQSGFAFPDGTTDASVVLKERNDELAIGVDARSKTLAVTKGNITMRLNAHANIDARYQRKQKKLTYKGKMSVQSSQMVSSLLAGKIEGIYGALAFDNSGIWADNLRAIAYGIPIEAKMKLSDFKQPTFALQLTSRPSLEALKRILRDEFNIRIPASLEGQSMLTCILSQKPTDQTLQINGAIDLLQARAQIEKYGIALQEISGRLEFSPTSLSWKDLRLTYKDTAYKTTGTLSDFQNPLISTVVSSQDLKLATTATINERMVEISELRGRYLNSEFSVKADLNVANPNQLDTQASGDLIINLEDSAKIFKEYKSQLEKLKASGTVKAQFVLSGNLKDFPSCMVQAQFSSNTVSAYGLRTGKFILNFAQSDGVAELPLAEIPLYDGKVALSCRMNLNAQSLPYWVGADFTGIRIEKLKTDTPMRDKDIAGTLRGQAHLNGFIKDASRLSGAGELYVSEGKLWELNLFRGLGELLFAKNFESIVFYEGSCAFVIQQERIISESLTLKSNLANLVGGFSIGFDGSLDGSLNVQVLDEFVPETGTIKDVTTAIIGKAGRFGVIRVSGTLKEPKYKFRAAVSDILKSLKDSLFENIFR